MTERDARKNARSAASTAFFFIVVAEIWFLVAHGITPPAGVFILLALVPWLVAVALYHAGVSHYLNRG